MDGVGAARDGGRDDRLFIQIRFRRVRRPDIGDFVRHPRGKHLPVGGASGLDGTQCPAPSPRG